MSPGLLYGLAGSANDFVILFFLSFSPKQTPILHQEAAIKVFNALLSLPKLTHTKIGMKSYEKVSSNKTPLQMSVINACKPFA